MGFCEDGVSKENTLSVEMRPVAELRPFPRNAKVHSGTQVRQIAQSIKRFGWTNPVLIDPVGGIIAGHGRVLAAQYLKQKQVPCIVLAELGEDEKRAYILADNRLNELSSWDKDILSSELKGLEFAGLNLGFLEFDRIDLGGIAGAKIEFEDDADDSSDPGAHTARGPSDEPAPQAVDKEPEKARSVFPLVLSLSRAQYDRWQEMKKDAGMTDVQLFAELVS